MQKLYHVFRYFIVPKTPHNTFTKACIISFLLLGFCALNRAGAQSKTKITIIGTVTDTLGTTIVGANIAPVDTKIKGVNTASDANGRFVLDVEPGTVLKVTYVGFLEKHFIASADQKIIKIALSEAKSQFNDVVITAYGRKQTRESIVGAVTSVKPADLKIPASNLTTALAGQVAGVIAYQPSGQPGLDNASFFIRGVTTFGYSEGPLILVDGVETSADIFARLNVDDIESFSILKDATSTALYGARGGNGVLLIKTKEGKAGKPEVNIRVEDRSSQSVRTISIADPVTYMKLFNEATATRNPLAPLPYSQNQIYNTQATIDKAPGSNPYVYPAVDWLGMLFKNRTTTQSADISLTGGSPTARYYVAGSYSNDNGILRTDINNNNNNNIKFDTYSLRSNVNINITSKTELVVQLFGSYSDYNGPQSADGSFSTDMYNYALHTSPVDFPAYYLPDAANIDTKHILFGNKPNPGVANSTAYINPYAELLKGHKNFSTSYVTADFTLNQNLDSITPGLNLNGFFETDRNSSFTSSQQYLPFYYTIGSYDQQTNKYVLQWLNSQPGQAQEYLSYVPGGSDVTARVDYKLQLNYNHTFAQYHTVDATLVSERQQSLDGNASTLFDALPHRNQTSGAFLGYSYKAKYYFNAVFGYNGSERFSANHRFGFFPTVGGAWLLSEEKFWGDLYNVFDRFKIAVTYGLSGNDQISGQRFYYLSDVDLQGGNPASFGTNNGYTRPGVKINNYENDDVTWEKGKKTNIGIELTALKKINFRADFWRENKYDILEGFDNSTVPATVGLETGISANVGKVQSQGLELNLDGSQKLSKDFSILFRGNFTFSENKFVAYAEPGYKEKYRSLIGQPLWRNMGYVAERLFVDDNEAKNSPSQIFSSNGPPPQGGDIKYRDLNGDGKIDAADQTYIGNPIVPQIVYGFGVSGLYKNFDLGLYFTGQAKVSFQIDPSTTSPFIKSSDSHYTGNTQLLQAYADNHWSEDNQNLYALYPRLGTNGDIITNNRQSSTWWLRDGSFMRLKNLTFGYNLAKSLSKSIGVKTVRIYFTGENLITWSPFKLWDPELGGSAFNYPIQKIYNLGLSVGM